MVPESKSQMRGQGGKKGVPNECYQKRVAMVTGANRGLGFETARQVAQKDIMLLLGARDNKSGPDARQMLPAQQLDVH